MKTTTNPRKNSIASAIFIAMMILSLVGANSIQAQWPIHGPDFVSLMNQSTDEDTVNTTFSNLSDDSKGKEMVSGQNKKAFGHNVQMLVSILREPFISKRSRNQGPYDVIIVPGIPFDDEKGAGTIMKARVKWAHYLVSNGIAKNVIFSGSAVYTPYTESRIMALYAMEMGMPAGNIFCETKAEHSTENVVYSLRLAEELGFEKIAIATGPFQSAFLDKYVRDHSLPVSFIAIPLIYKGTADSDAFHRIDPSNAMADHFVSLKDRESKEERYQGTLGNRIVD